MASAIKYSLLFFFAAVLLLTSAFLRPVWYDDAGHFIVIRQLAEMGEVCYPVDMDNSVCEAQSPFITVGPAFNYPLSLALKLLGREMIAARMTMVIVSLLSLMGFFFLCNRILNEYKAMWATAIVMGNIQFLTYGAEVLGEVPMLGWIFLALYFLVEWIRKQQPILILPAIVAFSLAIQTKEYIVAPIITGLAIWAIISFFRKHTRHAFGSIVTITGIIVVIFLVYFIRLGSVNAMFDYLDARNSYGAEFFTFSIWTAFKYILFKPLIVLGMIALAVKVWSRKDQLDYLFLALFVAQLFFFFSSAGYDRFGFQLIFIPALYFSEFMVTIWKRWVNVRKLKILKASVIIVLGFLIFWQKSFPVLVSAALSEERTNENEKVITRMLLDKGYGRVVTYDQQIVPFLPSSVSFRLSPVVPSNAENCAQLEVKKDEVFLASAYAFTEYPDCVPWNELTPIDSTGEGMYRWVMYVRE